MNRSPMTTPELIQWLRENSSGVYRPEKDAADLLVRMTDRETALIAALRLARDYIDTLLDLEEKEAADALGNMGENITKHLNNALHLNAFDVGDRVIAESADLGLCEYEGFISSKRIALDGTALFTVTDSEENGNDHEAREMRLA